VSRGPTTGWNRGDQSPASRPPSDSLGISGRSGGPPPPTNQPRSRREDPDRQDRPPTRLRQESPLPRVSATATARHLPTRQRCIASGVEYGASQSSTLPRFEGAGQFTTPPHGWKRSVAGTRRCHRGVVPTRRARRPCSWRRRDAVHMLIRSGRLAQTMVPLPDKPHRRSSAVELHTRTRDRGMKERESRTDRLAYGSHGPVKKTTDPARLKTMTGAERARSGSRPAWRSNEGIHQDGGRT